MADTTISGLSSASSLVATDILPAVHSGSTYKVTAQQIYGANRRDGISAEAKADGTGSVTITFSPSFPVSLIKLDAFQYVNYTGTDVPVFVPSISSAGPTGFTFSIYGGQPGTAVDVHWGATGT